MKEVYWQSTSHQFSNIFWSVSLPTLNFRFILFTRNILKNKDTLVSFRRHEQKLNPRGESVLGSLI